MLETALTLALCVLFIHATTWEGMINAWIRGAFFDAPEWVKKPLYDCPICMAPWWGFGLWLIGSYNGAFPYLNPYQLIITLFVAGGINTVLIYVISYGRDED